MRTSEQFRGIVDRHTDPDLVPHGRRGLRGPHRGAHLPADAEREQAFQHRSHRPGSGGAQFDHCSRRNAPTRATPSRPAASTG